MIKQVNKLREYAVMSFGAFCMFFAFGAQASLIHTFDHSYLSGNIQINLNVFDDQPGGRYLWEYTVINDGFDPLPGTTNGFSGFELYLPTSIPEIADITPNDLTGWNVNCCSGHPVEWDISRGLGIMPGKTGIFSFTTDPRDVAINNDGWFHTWRNGSQSNIINTSGMHVPWVPGLTPVNVPEPGVMVLFALGMIGLGFVRRLNQKTA